MLHKKSILLEYAANFDRSSMEKPGYVVTIPRANRTMLTSQTNPSPITKLIK